MSPSASSVPNARFELIAGNRLDVLAARLGARIATPAPGADALSAETVLVPQPALRHWLMQALAEQHGVAAHLDIRTPSEFVWGLLRAATPTLPADSPWERERLRWTLYALLSEIPRALPEPVRQHLARAVPNAGAAPGGADGIAGDGIAGDGSAALARFALAGQVAGAFDRYLAYRPDWLREWDAGKQPDDWQAALWRLLRQRLGPAPHRAELIADWLVRHDRSHNAEARAPAGLPPRLSAFGTLHVSPDTLRLLAVCAQWCAVDFYLPTPCAEYWGDVERLRERLRREDEDAREQVLADADADNPLLAEWGAGGRGVVAQLYSYELVQPQIERECFVPPGRDSLLHRLQDDVLHRAPPRAEGPLPADDASVRIHACHSRLREVEVLHDALRAMLDPDSPEGRGFDPPLQPREIAVMAPDIGAYLPLVRAVFGGLDEHDARYIPFSLADRPQAQSHPLMAVFLALLDLADTPLRVAGFRDLLATPALARGLGLDANAQARVQAWLEAAGIRWGEDAEARVRANAGRWRDFSFDFGFDRLLAGYAAGADSGLLALSAADEIRNVADALRRDTPDIAPYPELEGGDADLLDGVLAVYDRLRRLGAWMRRPQSAADWQLQLAQAFLALLPAQAEDAAESQARQRVLDVLANFAEEAEASGLLPAALVRQALRERLLQPPAHQPWLAGGVTFAGMVPLRTVPFRVICLLGLDADAYPRREAGGDVQRLVDALQGRAPRRLGDRSVREDDRFLLLQLLCAAGDALHLSYGGRDARDGSLREPSLLVSELLETVERMHGEAAAKQLRVEHPLQPFSPRAFGAADADADAGEDGDTHEIQDTHEVRDTHEAQGPRIDPRRFSYRREWQLAPGTGLGLRPPPPFVPPGFALPAPADAHEATTADTGEAPIRSPDRDQLRRFFDNPARAWLQDRLGLHLPELPEEAEDREPQGAHRLRRYQLIAALLPATDAPATPAAAAAPGEANSTPPAIVRSLRARALLPPGRDGEVALEDAQPVADSLERARRAQTAPAPAPADTLDTVRDALQQAMADDTPRLIVEAQAPVAFRFDDVLRLRNDDLLRVVVDAGTLNGKRLLRAGIDHLLLAAEYGERTRTCLITSRKQTTNKDGEKAAPEAEVQNFSGMPQAQALAHLRALLALWHEGQRAPLPFAPKAAWSYANAYADARGKSKTSAEAEVAAWSKATDAFNPASDRSLAGASESEDPYIALAYRPDAMLDPPDSPQALRFRALALQVFDGLGRLPPEKTRGQRTTSADKRASEGGASAGAATKKAARATKAGTSAGASKSTARTRKPPGATEPPP